MGRTKKPPKCRLEGCSDPRSAVRYKNRVISGYDSFCSTHRNKATINRFLSRLYRNIKQRVSGTNKSPEYQRKRHLYFGKSILPRDTFMSWAKNHPDFLVLYKRYFMSRFDRKLAPSVNRMDSTRGYTLDNMEWMTFSQNCALAGTVRKLNNKERKVIYQVLGVKQ